MYSILVGLTFAMCHLIAFAESPLDSDGDGIPDQWELRHNMATNDPADAALDYDLDGFSNLEEYQANTDPGRDLVGYKKYGKAVPLQEWSDEEMLEYLDASIASPSFFDIIQYRYVNNRDRARFLTVLENTAQAGVDALEEGKPCPKGLAAAVRFLHKEALGSFPPSLLLRSTNVSLQAAVVCALGDAPVNEEDLVDIIQSFDQLAPELKGRMLSRLGRINSPKVHQFLLMIDDPALTNQARSLLRKCSPGVGP